MVTLVRNSVWAENCPSCRSVNYYDGEDSAHMPVSYAAILCWKCSHEFTKYGYDDQDSEDAVQGRDRI